MPCLFVMAIFLSLFDLTCLKITIYVKIFSLWLYILQTTIAKETALLSRVTFLINLKPKKILKQLLKSLSWVKTTVFPRYFTVKSVNTKTPRVDYIHFILDFY